MIIFLSSFVQHSSLGLHPELRLVLAIRAMLDIVALCDPEINCVIVRQGFLPNY